MRRYEHEVIRTERRALEIKDYNHDSGYLIYKFSIKNHVDIKIDITPDEIKWLYETDKKIRRMLKKESK